MLLAIMGFVKIGTVKGMIYLGTQIKLSPCFLKFLSDLVKVGKRNVHNSLLSVMKIGVVKIILQTLLLKRIRISYGLGEIPHKRSGHNSVKYFLSHAKIRAG